MKHRKTWMIIILFILASFLPAVLFRETIGSVPTWFLWGRIGFFLLLFGVFQWYKSRELARMTLVLAAFNGVDMLLISVQRWEGFRVLFPGVTLLQGLQASIALKMVSAIVFIILLRILFKRSQDAYLVVGDLSAWVEPIPFLNIRKRQIRWGRLAFISGFAIAGGTLLLTLITVTGFSFPPGMGERWLQALPWIFLLALGNAFSEGILFRNTLLSVLKNVVPVATAVLIAAGFFGVAHYYGAPRGVLGVVMSSVLGWFLCRSMVDTRGLAAPWFIHFLQDLVIFSTMVMLL